MGLLSGIVAGTAGALGQNMAEEQRQNREFDLRMALSEIDDIRARARAVFQNDLAVKTKIGEEERAVERRDKDAAAITMRAGEIAAGRKEVEPVTAQEFDQGAVRINDMKNEGLLSPQEAEQGFAEVARQHDASAKPGKPTTKDYMTAQAERTGNWKDVAMAESREGALETRQKIAELQNSTRWAEIDAKTQIALTKLDAMLARGERTGNVPTQIQQIEYLMQEHGLSKEAARDLVYHPDGKVGEYDTTKTKRMLPDGSEEETTSKRKAGSGSSGAQTRFKWQNGKIVPQ